MPADLINDDVDLVEGTDYDHADHGRVRVLLVDDDHVVWEHTEKTIMKTPLTKREPEREFRVKATPAPITVNVPTVDAPAETHFGGK